jgi:hypothetical protein
MDGYRAAGRVEAGEGTAILFRGLEGLERMVEVVRESGEPPSPDPELANALFPASGSSAALETSKKKLLSRPSTPRRCGG